MEHERTRSDDWVEVIAPLSRLVDLSQSARAAGALLRCRGVADAEGLLRLILAWGPGKLSLRQAAAWAGVSGTGAMCDSAVLRRLRKAPDWLEALVQVVLTARAAALGVPDAATLGPELGPESRLIRLVDGSTFGVVGQDKPGWRLVAGFDLPSARLGRLALTDAATGEKLECLAVTPREVRIADRGFARPAGLRHAVAQGGDFLVRLGSRSLKLRDGNGAAVNLPAAVAQAGRVGVYDADVTILHSRNGTKAWPGVPARLVICPLPAEAAQAARRRCARAGQRESYTPSPRTEAAAGSVMLITSLDRATASAETLLGLYRLRWQIELAFKRLKSLLGMRTVPTRCPALARTWLLAHLLLALLVEDAAIQVGESFPSAAGF
jgi:Transposase DDE domain